MSDFLNQWGSYYGPAMAGEDTTAGDIASVGSRLGCDEPEVYDYEDDYEEPEVYEDEDDYEDDDYDSEDDYEDDDYDSEDDYEDDNYDSEDDYEDDDYEDDDYEDEDESCREGDDCDGAEDDSAPTYASYEDAYQAGYDAAVHSYENIPDLTETDDLDLDL